MHSIPITNKDGRLFSYWISYRGGNPAKIGLSIHLVRYAFGGAFGALYDSWQYDVNDVNGDRKKSDSFLGPESCYYIGPSGFMRDIELVDVEQVHPVICTQELVEGTHAKVNVFFLSMSSMPPDNTADGSAVVVTALNCNTSGATTDVIEVDATKHNIIHVQKTGYDATVGLKMCSGTATSDMMSQAYLYDK
jgi:hypothetical protein